MRRASTLSILALFLCFSVASAPDGGDDGPDGGADGGVAADGGTGSGEVAERVVSGLEAASEITVALAEGNANADTVGQLVITSYTGSSACTLADPVGDAVEIRVNLERQAGCNYTTVICTEEELCFSQSSGSAWAQVFEASTLESNVRAAAGAITLSQEELFGDTCTVDVDIGFADGATFAATYELESSGLGGWCETISQ